jgi:hypothetical protein
MSKYKAIDTEALIKELKDRHGGNTYSLIAWFIGYTNRLERDLNKIRDAVGSQEKTLVEMLKEDIEDKRKG